jgi:hypothetical protein
MEADKGQDIPDSWCLYHTEKCLNQPETCSGSRLPGQQCNNRRRRNTRSIPFPKNNKWKTAMSFTMFLILVMQTAVLQIAIVNNNNNNSTATTVDCIKMCGGGNNETFNITAAATATLNTTPVDFCPVERTTNWAEGERYYQYFQNNKLVKMTFCFGTYGPVIELRELDREGKPTGGGGMNLNPYQFRFLFSNISEIEKQLEYIPQ